jgi:signal transduction histidine kinase
MNLPAQSILPEASEAAQKAITQLLLEALPSGAVVIDSQGKVAALNLQAERLLGWAAPTLEGKSAHEALDCRLEGTVEDSDPCPIASVLSGEAAESHGHMWIRCRDRSFRPIEYRCLPYPTLSGLGTVLAFRDLSRQMELEKDLRRLASIAEQSPIAIVELNEDANMVHANPAMMSLIERFGFSSDARPSILPANIAKLTAECLDSQSEIGGIEVSVGANHYEWKLVPVMRERLVRGYGVDLTARKRAEIELKGAKAKAEAASHAKSEFLANTSHELRSPIHVILGIADLLAKSAVTDQQIGYVRTVHSCAKSLLTVIDDILAIAALEAGNVTIETTSFDFRAFIAESAAPFIEQAEKKGLRLTITIANTVPSVVQCDRKQLAQVLQNFLSNAVKFTDRGQVALEVDRDSILTQRSGATGNGDGTAVYLFFTVRDTGIGIPHDKLKVIFDSFSQADGSSSRCYEGTGLGLAISKQLVDLMGGTVGVESEPGKGSRFWFSLPMQCPVPPEVIITTKKSAP